MYVFVAGFPSRLAMTAVLLAGLLAACGSTQREDTFAVTNDPDGVMDVSGAGTGAGAGGSGGGDGSTLVGEAAGCDMVRMDGDALLELDQDFTARFRLGEAYTRTVMLFSGEPYDANIVGNGYFFGLDKADAEMLAAKYPDFYLCSSPGGMEAMMYIEPYDFVPADCGIFDQILTAFAQYDENVKSGGDRTSLRFDGVPLELESVTANSTGEDVTDQVTDQSFHLITSVEQLTGESVLSFGAGP